MKLLKGYVKNKTKEAALAAMMLALFFVTRTFKWQILPNYLLDLSGIFSFIPPTFLSWPYTIVFALTSLYGGSNPIAFLGYLVGCQTCFFSSKLLKPKWRPHIPAWIGPTIGVITYGVFMDIFGLVDARAFLIMIAPLQVISNIRTHVGSIILWKYLRRFGLIEDMEIS